MGLKKIKIMKSSLQQFWELSKSRHSEKQTRVSGQYGSYPETSFEALYTSPEDLSAIFQSALVQGTFADLGCGFGIAPILYGMMFPERLSLGVEFEKSRLEEGDSFLRDNPLSNVKLMERNLLFDPIPEADTYFLYFPAGPVLDRILYELYSRKNSFNLVAIESHGDLLARLELENWLTLKEEIPLKAGRHYPFVKIYQRNFSERSLHLLPFNHSYEDHFVVIEENNESWIGSTKGMEWTEGDRFELKCPPRTIRWRNVKKLMLSPSDSGTLPARMVSLWKEGEVSIKTIDRIYQGCVRKIIISPSFKLEISSGEKVEWDKIQIISRGPHICYDSSSSF